MMRWCDSAPLTWRRKVTHPAATESGARKAYSVAKTSTMRALGSGWSAGSGESGGARPGVTVLRDATTLTMLIGFTREAFTGHAGRRHEAPPTPTRHVRLRQ